MRESLSLVEPAEHRSIELYPKETSAAWRTDHLHSIPAVTKVGLKFTVALTVEPVDSLTKALIVVLSFKSVLVPLLLVGEK